MNGAVRELFDERPAWADVEGYDVRDVTGVEGIVIGSRPLDGGGWAAPAPRAQAAFAPGFVKAMCAQRILAVADEVAQRNMASAAAAGWPGEADAEAAQAAFVAGVEWVAAMRAVCATLIAEEDATYGLNSHWPPCPAEAAALAARF